jgi:hypothetical protein
MTTQNQHQFVYSSPPIQPSRNMRFSRDRFGKKRKGDIGGDLISDPDGCHNRMAGISYAAKRSATAAAAAASSSIRTAATSKRAKHPRLATAIPNTKFESVMDRPFSPWNDMEAVIAKFVPSWTHRHRGCILRHTIRFLELKVVMDELVSSHLLEPSRLVEVAWRALLLETRLYKRVTCYIHDFHGRKRRTIHHSMVNLHNEPVHLARDRFLRAQSLFQCCYGEQMPVTLEDLDAADTASSLDDTSEITDALDRIQIANDWTTLMGAGADVEGRDLLGPMPIPDSTTVSIQRRQGTSTGASSDTTSGIIKRMPKPPLFTFRQRSKSTCYEVDGAVSCLDLLQETMFGRDIDFYVSHDNSVVTPEEDETATATTATASVTATATGVEVIDIPDDEY